MPKSLFLLRPAKLCSLGLPTFQAGTDIHKTPLEILSFRVTRSNIDVQILFQQHSAAWSFKAVGSSLKGISNSFGTTACCPPLASALHSQYFEIPYWRLWRAGGTGWKKSLIWYTLWKIHRINEAMTVPWVSTPRDPPLYCEIEIRSCFWWWTCFCCTCNLWTVAAVAARRGALDSVFRKWLFWNRPGTHLDKLIPLQWSSVGTFPNLPSLNTQHAPPV